MADDAARAAALARVASARAAGPDALVALYAAWADGYDADLDALGLVGSRRIAELLIAHLPDRSAPVLDLGCGTGLVGEHLARLGCTCVDGVDLSPEMLAVAAGKACYRSLAVGDLGVAAALPPGPYSASVSAGTFTSGHVGADAVAGILAVHAPAALIAWVIAASVWPAFDAALGVHGVSVIAADVEPIRAGGPAESVMLIGRLARR